MPTIRANGVELFYELDGSGEPLVLVHGAWFDHTSWALVAPPLRERFQVLEENARSVQAVARKIEAGHHEEAARQFVEEVALGPGAWENDLPPPVREIFVENASTFLDETRDSDGVGADLDALASFSTPALVTHGTASPPVFPKMVATLVETCPTPRKRPTRARATRPT
jgi:hypothetical protein